MADIIVIGAGLAGLVAAVEAADRGRHVTLVDQEGRQNLGAQAFWSLGGLFMVDTPEQRRMGIRDSRDLAMADWLGSAAFDRAEDAWPRRWAEAFVDFAAGDMRGWLHGMGMRWFPVVGWAERGGGFAGGHGNSVPRFHLTWGVGPGVIAPFVDRAMAHARDGRIDLRFRHRVTRLDMADGAVTGVAGDVLEEDDARRGASSTRAVTAPFAIATPNVVVASGGIGGNFDMVRRNWPRDRLGDPPASMLSGVPAHVDGRMIDTAAAAGAEVVNADRMWHYTEGVANYDPIWPHHGIRILPGPSSLWLDATGRRLPMPCLPGFDTMATLRAILATGHAHSWFVTTSTIAKKEFALSGSEQNPDLESKDWRMVLHDRLLNRRATPAVEAFKKRGADFVVADDLDGLIVGMVTKDEHVDPARVRAEVAARDSQMDNPFSKDGQVMAIHAMRNHRGDRFMRTARPHRLTDPRHGPMIAVRLHVLTRKSLGGLLTDLDGRCLGADGAPVPGLFACGEAAGFGGGGYHGWNALEGTFLGGCLFSGRRVGRSGAL
ncbi:FAD-binding dehydrogenase [Jannaschia rubra]|uniref:FAD-binding dehydrogenase n=1 Tax=Jannaschia rubra TaxID=282197 RepID=UPI0024901651|nr:FAD-binding dehydrogenase [Jannaschia rubra]